MADQLVAKYRYENCAVVALSKGGVVVGEQIAAVWTTHVLQWYRQREAKL